MIGLAMACNPTQQSVHTKRGFTLLVAAVLASVVLSIGLALAHMSAQQLKLAGVARDSEDAFYAASSALECIAAADQMTWLPEGHYGSPFQDQDSAPMIPCALEDGTWQTVQFYFYGDTGSGPSFSSGEWVDESGNTQYAGGWFPSGNGCAYVVLTKGDDGRTTVFARGTNTCNFEDPDKLVERGLSATY